jgi:hypothetical protein
MAREISPFVVGFVPYGGLGNQLFQLATALSLREGRNDPLAIDLIGRDRKNSDDLPEIMDFDLDKISPIFIRNKSRSSFLRYLVEVQLRMSNKIILNRILNSFLSNVQILFSQVTSALAGTRVLSPRGMGWDDKFRAPKKSYTILGNFHSYLFIDPKVRIELMTSLRSRNNTDLIEGFAKVALKDNPVAVHIRLGDYLSLNELNVVTREYFSRAISKIETVSPNSNYWVFTNDEDLALEYLPSHISSRIRMIPQSLNSAQTIEVMWLCDRYIISNSTFSWWGAYLSKSKNPIVIAPKNWFKTIAEPKDICPDGWIRL